MSGYADENTQYGYPQDGESQYISSSANAEGLIDAEGHLQVQDFEGSEMRMLDIGLPANMTLERLQREHPNGYMWEMPKELRNTMRAVQKTRNRTHATDEDLAGDLGKMLILGAEVVSERSNAPIDIGVDIPGMVPVVNNGVDRFNWIIDAGNGNTASVGRHIFVPDNLFSKLMYKRGQRCDMATLKRHINLEADPQKRVAHMETKGVGWHILMTNLEQDNNAFMDAQDSILAMNEHIFNAGETEHSMVAKVPYHVGEQVFEAIAEQLRENEKSYVNLNNFRVCLRPANGQAWDNGDYLISESYGFDQASKGAEKATELVRPIQAKLRLQLQYVLDGQ